MRKLRIISIVMLLFIVALLPKSNAALVSKPGTNALTRVSVSEAYLYCLGMKGLGESLYGAGDNVEPHLSTNKDWAAVSYLSNSIYGTNTKGGNTGLKVTINGKQYYSTNGNTSGVMNWGANPTKNTGTRLYVQTATLIKAYKNLENTSSCSAYNNVIELDKAAKNNSKFVEVVDTSSSNFARSSKGMALSEVKNFSSVQSWEVQCCGNTNSDYPIFVRYGIWSFAAGHWGNGAASFSNATGASLDTSTFRPVVWN